MTAIEEEQIVLVLEGLGARVLDIERSVIGELGIPSNTYRATQA